MSSYSKNYRKKTIVEGNKSMKRQNYDVMVKNGKRKTENRRNRYLCVILFFGVDVAKIRKCFAGLETVGVSTHWWLHL